MKNLLIINQHASNHGDEAAGKALLRKILDTEKNYDIGILYNTKTNHESDFLKVDHDLEHYEYGDLTTTDKVLIGLTFIVPFFITRHLFMFGNTIKHEFEILKRYDKIINAPGGVNIGIYKDWRYLWRLFVSLKLEKPTAIYSISFGPLPKNLIFANASIKVLRNASFLSLRDSKSQKYADDLGIGYINAIDTAFLNNQPVDEFPSELVSLLKNEYVVIVPNELFRWHVNYQHIADSQFSTLYTSIIDFFVNHGLQVVLLPQMFGSENDISYFKSLKEKIKFDQSKVMVLSESYSSDVQQKIVSHSKFLVGARYHSVIFAINNKIPFVSLAYEHKMTNTLQLLGLLDFNLIIDDLLKRDDAETVKILSDKFRRDDLRRQAVASGNILAQTTAQNTFNHFSNKFLLL